MALVVARREKVDGFKGVLSKSVDGALCRASNDFPLFIRAYFTAGATYFVIFSGRGWERASEPHSDGGDTWTLRVQSRCTCMSPGADKMPASLTMLWQEFS